MNNTYILYFFGLLLTLNFLGILFLIWLIGGFYKKISVISISGKHSLEKMHKELEEERNNG